MLQWGVALGALNEPVAVDNQCVRFRNSGALPVTHRA
jgi:hypothetical protein